MLVPKIFKVAWAISEAEGWIPKTTDPNYPNGSASYINHNPGNLRASSFACGVSGGFAIFENDFVGYFAIIHQLYIYAAGRSKAVSPDDTIAHAICVYTGLTPDSNEYPRYIGIIENVGGVSRSDLISNLLE